jgi:hypothetical protein
MIVYYGFHPVLGTGQAQDGGEAVRARMTETTSIVTSFSGSGSRTPCPHHS